MAKRKAKPKQKLIAVEVDDVAPGDGEFDSRARIVGKKTIMVPQDALEGLAQTMAMIKDPDWRLGNELAAWDTVALQRMKDWKCEDLKTIELCADVHRIVEFLRESLKGGASASVVTAAITLGRAIENLHLRPLKPAAVRGKGHSRGSHAGGASRRAQELAKWQQWQDDAARLELKHPGTDKRALARMIANQHKNDDFKGSPETIRKKI